MEKFQVNVTEYVDGHSEAWISRHNEDGYVGRLTDTVYQDGSDVTDWCVFAGTQQQCQEYIDKLKKQP